MNQAKINLEQWCSVENELHKQPITFKGKSHATDGFALLIVPAGDREYFVPNGASKGLANKMQLIANKGKELAHSPMNYALDLPEPEKCKKCRGSGKAKTEICPECDGDGDVYFENDHNQYCCTCSTCYGHQTIYHPGGDEPCRICKGSGSVYPWGTTVEIEGITIQAKYYKRLQDIRALEVAGDPEAKMLFFRTPGSQVHGVIMGMSI